MNEHRNPDADSARKAAHELLRDPYVPASTYRVQMNSQFTFAHAAETLDYFAGLGVDALYFSPYLQAAPGSMHGYDMIDPTRLNAEIGSEADYKKLCAGLRERRMGHIADVVPNHMGIAGNANPWWQDVLESGQDSLYADVFDIDWNPIKAELQGRVLLPVLGELYGQVLEKGELSVCYDGEAFSVHYWDHRFPVDPGTYPVILEHRRDELKGKFGPDSPVLDEFDSVIAELRALSSKSGGSPSDSDRRRRERNFAKRRLAELVGRNPVIREWLDGLLKELNGEAGRPESFAQLHEFLEVQRYRLAYWRMAADEINYRRFFDINALAAIRIENEDVFALHHSLIMRLVREGCIQGMRIDHPDGLYDPAGYFRRLQESCCRELIAAKLGVDTGSLPADCLSEGAWNGSVSGRMPFYVVAEKILDLNEDLPTAWPISGTVGYDFLNSLNGLYVERSNESEFDKIYREYIGHDIDYDRLVYDKKKFFSLVNMASETSALGHHLDRISEHDWHSRDLTRNLLTLAIREMLACFPVYRTYVPVGDGEVPDRDRRYIRAAIGKARSKLPALHPGIFDFLERVLFLDPEYWRGDELLRVYRDFVLRFQQISGPIMAKGVEDTAFYVFNRLLSLNEVGGDPNKFGWTRTQFHEQLSKRLADWPNAMLGTSTHDTKRSEDVRMRINVVSEIPFEWKARIAAWSKINECHKTGLSGILEPRRNTEYFIYQTLLGIWPNGEPDASERTALLGRVWDAVLKSSREAKIYTNWTHPDSDYEEALLKFVAGIFSNDKFLESFLPFQRKVALYGMLNSLSALTLKLAAPGVPDIYQGNEIWDYSLVDPDNRRRIDFGLRAAHLRSLTEMESVSGAPTPQMAGELLNSWQDGRIKMHILRQGLGLRRGERSLFLEGEYIPLEVQGMYERNVVAFARRHNGRVCLVAAGRNFAGMLQGPGTVVDWKNTALVLPDGLNGHGSWRNVLTGETVRASSEDGKCVISLATLMRILPSALMVNNAA